MDPDLDAIEAALLAERELLNRANDPLKWFKWASENHKSIAKSLVLGNEVYARAPNQSGKTHCGAAICVAMARGLKELDGQALPYLGVPNTGLVLVHSYKLASESSVKLMLEMVGDWPHKVENGSQNTVQAIRIRPDSCNSDDPKDWSRIIIHPEEGPLPTGMRLDFAWGDEPPSEKYWRQIRGRRRANRPFPRLITATPLERARWEWLRREFTGHEYPGVESLCEVRIYLHDNRFLGPQHIRSMEKDFANDPLKDAILNGDYVDTTGMCPFDSKGLSLWEKTCFKGEIKQYDAEDVEVWYPVEAEEDYFVVCDPSSGIWDGKGIHDPSGICVVSRRKPRLVARYNGYRSAYELGRLAVSLARDYNDALVVHERNSGFGESFLHGVGDYGNLYIEHRTDRKSGLSGTRIGWQTTATTKGTIIGALQKAIKEQGIEVHSIQVVDCLRSISMGPDRRVLEVERQHDEDMIVLGLACHLLETTPIYGVKVVSLKDKVMSALGLRRMEVQDAPFDV